MGLGTRTLTPYWVVKDWPRTSQRSDVRSSLSRALNWTSYFFRDQFGLFFSGPNWLEVVTRYLKNVFLRGNARSFTRPWAIPWKGSGGGHPLPYAPLAVASCSKWPFRIFSPTQGGADGVFFLIREFVQFPPPNQPPLLIRNLPGWISQPKLGHEICAISLVRGDGKMYHISFHATAMKSTPDLSYKNSRIVLLILFPLVLCPEKIPVFCFFLLLFNCHFRV